MGKIVFIFNQHATNSIDIFPSSGDQMGTSAVDAAITLSAGNGTIFIALDATEWAWIII